MELDLQRTCLDVYETGEEWAVTQDETAETIVPDYCPDIARIIKSEGKVYIHSRNIRDGKTEISGTVRVTVLYTPEGENGIRVLDFSMPFAVENDQRVSEGDCLIAETTLELVETRMLNPRKVFTHCKLLTQLAAYQKKTLCFCTDVEVDKKLQIEKRQEQQRAVFLTHIAEKDFTFSETMKLSPGREGAVEILSKQVRSSVSDTKIVGNKLIFKGLFGISCLYRPASGVSGSITGELPYSQIMDVEGASETAKASMLLQLTGMDIRLDSSDAEGRLFEITLYLHAIARLYEEREMTLLSDLYSTAYETRYDAAPLRLHGFFETLGRRQMVREVLETGAEVQTILSVEVVCEPVSIGREHGNAVLRTGAMVRVLYLDEGNVPLLAERCLDVSCQLELPEDCQLNARAVCLEEVQGSIGERGIEVRFPVDFAVEAVDQVKQICIASAELEPSAVKDFTDAPSLVLRCLGKQESVWDLAKKYHTTISTILAANQLEQETDILRDRLLLIPRKRA